MTTYNTGNPLGSSAAKDLYDNAQNFDHLSNDQSNELWPDRFGNPRLTWHGMEIRYQEKLASMGWTLIDSFQDGANLTRADEALRWKLPDGDGEYYRWDGAFPKTVPAGSTPESTGGIGLGAWVSVGDASLRSQLASENGASLIYTKDGVTVQEELNANKRVRVYENLDSAKLDKSEKDILLIKWKYGVVEYVKTDTIGEPSSGDGYIFFDAVGSGYIVHANESFNPNGIISFTELWIDSGLDPSIFSFAKSFGISTFVTYTYMADGVQDYLKSWIKCAELYGIQIILQIYPEVSKDFDLQISYFNEHMNMDNVVGYYIVDEPTPSTVPISKQETMIQKAMAVRNLPTYAATNQDLFGGDKYLHKDIDHIFTSIYAYFVSDTYSIYGYYMANLISLYEENGLRKGRVIPLLTTYRFTDEGNDVDDEFVINGNNYWISRFEKVAFWTFYTQHTPKDVHRTIENNNQIQIITKKALRKIQDTQWKKSIIMSTRNGQSSLFNSQTDKFLIGGSEKKYLFNWLNKNSTGSMVTSGEFDGAWALASGEMLIINLHDSYNIEYIRFNIINGTGDSVVYRLVISPVDNSSTLVSDLEYIGSADVIFNIPESMINSTCQIGLFIVSRSSTSAPRDLYVNDIRMVGAK